MRGRTRTAGRAGRAALGRIRWLAVPAAGAALALVLGAVPAAAAQALRPGTAASPRPDSGTAAKRAVLRIRLADLPAKVAASVTVTGPARYRRTLTKAAVLSNLAPGKYTVSPHSVRDTRKTLYVPTAGPSTLTLAAGSSVSRTVDYLTRVPASTRAVAASSVASVTSGAGGRLTVAVRGTSRYAVGQVLAAGIGRHTPNGLLARVTAVRAVRGGQTVTAVPATLRQAFPQGQLDFSKAFAAQAPGAVPRSAAPAASTASTAPAAATAPATATTPAAATSATGLPAWTKNVSCGGTAQAALSGSLSASLSTALHTHWSPLGVTASATATAHESSSVTASLGAGARCTVAPVEVGTPHTLGVFDVQIGPIPVVVVPKVSFFVRGAFSGQAAATASAGQDFTATAGLSYAGGDVTPIASAVASTTHQAPLVQGTAHVVVSVSTRLTLALYGLAGPVINLDPGLDLTADTAANPWWKLDGTLDAGATLKIPALGINASNSKIISKRFPLAHAAGAFPALAVLDVPVGGNAVDSPVLGPDGRLWLTAWDSAGTRQVIEAVDPTTRAIQTYRQVAAGTTGTLGFSGPLAFDGAGGLWLTGSSNGGTPSGPVLIRFTPSSGLFTTYAVPAACLTPPGGMATASDGYVWASCNGYGSDTVVSRISSGGTITSYHAPAGAPILNTLVPGANGSMWAMGRGNSHTSVVEIGTDGQGTVFNDGPDLSGLFLAGNGTGYIVEAALCGPAGIGTMCYQVVDTNGTRKPLGTLPGTDSRYGGQAMAPALDRFGNLWALVVLDSSSVVPPGQNYFYELSPLASGTVHPFTMPPDDQAESLQPVRNGAPVITSDGALWLEQAQWPAAGHLLRVAVGLD